MLIAKARSAVLWSGADILLKHGLQLGVSVALARLLSPEAFGTVALLYLFLGIAGAFVDSGLSAALIQKRDVTSADESTVFWLNLGVASSAALLLWASAPTIGRFYKQPILVPLTGVMALNLVVGALGSIHGTLLSKRLDFRTQMKISGLATVCSGTVAVVTAWKGFGVWALAAQTLTATVATTTLLWIFSPWRPSWEFSLLSARRLFGFGGYMLASQLLEAAYSRVYTLLIGKLGGSRDLGFYERANSTQQIPTTLLSFILGRVSLPIFSEAAQDRARLRRGAKLALRGIMLINVPAMLGVAVTAEPLVLTLFGGQWLPSVPPLRVLCIGALFWPLHGINLGILMAQGHSHLFFRLQVVKNVVGIVFLALGCSFGIMGIAWAVTCYGAVGFAINAYYTQRYLAYGARAQLSDFLPIVVASIPMVLVVYYVGQVWHVAAWIKLAGQVVVGVAVFLLASWMSRLAALRDAMRLVRRERTIAAA